MFVRYTVNSPCRFECDKTELIIFLYLVAGALVVYIID